MTWALYSPWTKGLCAELGGLVEGKKKTKTSQILKKQVSVVGRKLLEIVGQSGTTGREVEVEWEWECLYYKGIVMRIVRK